MPPDNSITKLTQVEAAAKSDSNEAIEANEVSSIAANQVQNIDSSAANQNHESSSIFDDGVLSSTPQHRDVATVPREWRYASDQFKGQIIGDPSQVVEESKHRQKETAVSLGESPHQISTGLTLVSGYNGTHGQLEVDQVKSDMSMGPEECLLPPSQVGYRQSFACIPLPYADPYYNGLLAAYGPRAMIHCPQMLGMANARVPLPLDLPQDEPIYVNAKQYCAILRRRQYRAKLAAQNKLSKARKVYGLIEEKLFHHFLLIEDLILLLLVI